MFLINTDMMELIIVLSLSLLPLMISAASVVFLVKWKKYMAENTEFPHRRMVYVQNIFMLPLCLHSPIAFLVTNSDFGLSSWFLAQDLLLLLTSVGYIVFGMVLPLIKLIKKDALMKPGLYRANAAALLVQAVLCAVMFISVFIFLPIMGS